MNLTVHNVYFCFSEVGCTISLRDGTPCKDVPAHTPTLFVAQQADMVCSDPAAVVRELPNGVELLHGQMMKEQAAGGLPAGYKRVEYLESTGTQYIDTGVLPGNYDEIRYTAQLRVTRDDMAFAVIGVGAINSDSIANGCVEYMRRTTKDMLCFVHYNKHEGYVYGTRADGNLEKHNFIYNNGHAYGDFVKELTWTPKIKDAAKETYYVFARNNNGVQWPYEGRIYEISVTDGGVKKLHFLPCLDPTGAPCMYDLVSRKPFYNAGTGDFLFPTETATYGLRRVLPDWGKLTEHGLRRLYHAPVNYPGELYDYAMEHGYKPIIETEKPETGYWSPRWTETEDEIVLEWVETEPPDDEFGLPEEDLTNN